MKNQIDRFTCEQVFERLDDYLDRELAPRETRLIEEHLEICAWCAGTYRFQEETLRALRGRIQRVPAAPELQTRVFAALRRARSGSPASEEPVSGVEDPQN